MKLEQRYMDETDRHIYAKMSGQLFELSVDKGYSSIDFVETIFNSKVGNYIYAYTYGSVQYWLLHTYTMARLEEELTFKKGTKEEDFINKDVMWYAGYLYSYWATHHEIEAREMYKLAPLELIDRRFGFYHTQGYAYVIQDILDRPYKNNK